MVKKMTARTMAVTTVMRSKVSVMKTSARMLCIDFALNEKKSSSRFSRWKPSSKQIDGAAQATILLLMKQASTRDQVVRH